MEKPSTNDELRALTSARGIAAWMVVLFHLRLDIAGLSDKLLHFFAKGYLAVDFFFLLSGFVISLSWGDRLRADWREVPRFWQKRLARIWPLHLLILAGAVVFAVMLVAMGQADPVNYPFKELPLQIVLLQNWGFTDRLSWNVPAWSISCEFAAYLLFPLFVRAIDWRMLPSWLVIAAIGALIVSLARIVASGPSNAFDITHYGLIRCLIEFAQGGAVCALWLRWRSAPAIPACVSAAIFVLGLSGWCLGFTETLTMPVTFAALLLTLALTSRMRGNPFSWAPLHYLGEISYATYLSHFMTFVLFKLVFVDDPRAVPAGLIALYLLMVLATSVALYHLVERPAQEWVNRLRLPSRLRERPAEGLPKRNTSGRALP